MSKKILYALCLISTFFLMFFIVTTYAKYSSQSDKNVTFNMTSWKLLINNSDIANNSNFSSSIVPTFTNTTYISEGIIAPTSTGYFDIEIDCSATNLSFEYLLTVANTDSSVADFNVTGYSIDDFNTILPYSESITGEVLYNKENKINTTTIRVYVEWDDSQENISDNASDTNLAINNSTSSLNVSININQKIDTYDF